MWESQEEAQGHRRLVWREPLAGLDREALELLVRLRHPAFLGIDWIRCRAEEIEIATDLLRGDPQPPGDPPRPGATHRAAVVVAQVLGVDPATLRTARTPIGRPVLVPPPLDAVCRSAIRAGDASAPAAALVLTGRGAEVDLARESRRAATSLPHAIVFVGPPGSGRSSLLDLIGFDAALAGCEVARWPVARLAPGEGLVVLLVDDLGATAPRDLAAFVARAERGRRPLLVVAGAGPSFAADDLGGLEVDRVALGPLPIGSLRQAARVTGLAPERAEAVVRAASEGAGGNPLAFRLLLDRAIRASNAASPGEDAAARVGALAPGSQTILAAAAVLGRSATVARIGQVTGAEVDGHDLDDLVEERRGILRPLTGEIGILALALSPVAAAELEARAARLHEAAGESWVERACHLLRAGDHEGAAHLARQAVAATTNPRQSLADLEQVLGAGLERDPSLRVARARLRERSGELESAIEALDGLIPELGPGPLRNESLLILAEARARQGELHAAHEALGRIEGDGGTDPSFASRVSFVAGFVLYRQGAVAEARSAYELGLRRDPGAAEEARADGLSGLGLVLVREAGGSRRGEKLLAEAREIYRQKGCLDKLSRAFSREAGALVRRGHIDRALELHLEALETALAADDQTGAGECHVDVASVALDRGELKRAERHLVQALACFERTGDARSLTLARANLAAVAVELGRPGEAEPILSEALDWDLRMGARMYEALDWRFLGNAALHRGELDLAEERLERARALAVELEEPVAEAEALLSLALAALDRGRASVARDRSDAGLRALAPIAEGPLFARLRLIGARAALELEGGASSARLVAAAIRAGTASGDPSVRAEAALVAAVDRLKRGDRREATRRFRVAVEAAEAQERPDQLGRTLLAAVALADLGLEEGFVAACRGRAAQVYSAPDLRPRLDRAGIALLPPAAAASSLASDALVRLEDLLARGGDPAPSASAALELWRERVPCLRTALLGIDAGGLRVLAASRGDAWQGGPGEALDLALVVGERARLTAQAVLLAAVADDDALRAHPEVIAWGLGPVMAVTARRPFVLYADRRRAHPPFSDVERRFARALVERIGREDELWTRPGLAPAPAAALETDVGIVGRSPAMVRLASEIRAYAAFDLPVYLAGESGTGKELVASAIHRLGARQRRPFVALNCAALPEPLFESELFGHVRGAFTGASGDRDGILTRADGGILFLDEVGELTLPMQAKLLRVVELGEYRPVGTSSSRKVDVRFLSATNRHLENEVAAARFREDLYYRLMATARIDLPPLRERTGDVALLLGHFLAREALRHRVAELTVAPEALAALERHPYPGNVRELERLVAGLYARCAGRRIELGDLPSPVRGAGRIVGAMRDRSSLRTARLDFERHYLKGLLERHGGNRTHAARAAGVARQTLVAMLKRHRVEAEEGPPPGAPPPGGGLRIGPEAG